MINLLRKNTELSTFPIQSVLYREHYFIVKYSIYTNMFSICLSKTTKKPFCLLFAKKCPAQIINNIILLYIFRVYRVLFIINNYNRYIKKKNNIAHRGYKGRVRDFSIFCLFDPNLTIRRIESISYEKGKFFYECPKLPEKNITICKGLKL